MNCCSSQWSWAVGKTGSTHSVRSARTWPPHPTHSPWSCTARRSIGHQRPCHSRKPAGRQLLQRPPHSERALKGLRHSRSVAKVCQGCRDPGGAGRRQEHGHVEHAAATAWHEKQGPTGQSTKAPLPTRRIACTWTIASFAKTLGQKVHLVCGVQCMLSLETLHEHSAAKCFTRCNHYYHYPLYIYRLLWSRRCASLRPFLVAQATSPKPLQNATCVHPQMRKKHTVQPIFQNPRNFATPFPPKCTNDSSTCPTNSSHVTRVRHPHTLRIAHACLEDLPVTLVQVDGPLVVIMMAEKT